MVNDINTLSKDIGVRVKTIRRTRGITQEELGNRIGRSTEAISNIERSASLPPLDTLNKIAVELNVSLLDFFGAQSSSNEQVPKRAALETEIVLKLRAMDDATAETALKLISAL